ncbi:MAG: ATP-binding protein [Myxococcota bacterium]
MKNERRSSAKKKPARQAPTADAFEAFFAAVETPAALCDPELTLLTANPAFEALCGVKGAAGRKLPELLQGAEPAPPDGATRDMEVVCHSGQAVTVTLTRKAGTVAVFARNLSETAAGDSLAAAGRALLEHSRVEQALLELGRKVAGATSEEELIAVVAKGVQGLFPGRNFCVRICDQRTSALTSLYAEGQLREGARDVIVLRRSAAEKTHLPVKDLPPERVRVTDEEVPLMFVGSVRSICAPLVASGQLFGAINVEYPQGLTADLVADDRILIQLANQVAVGVRNAKLIDELTFVRKYLEELLEHANALILVVNRERRVVVFNRALARLTGWSKEEVLGQNVLQFIPPSEQMRVMRVIAASLKGERAHFETRVFGKQGREVRVSLATSSVLTRQGEVEGVIAIGQDLTQMKELEGRVIQAEKMASLGQLAASVVHEINNPMTAVLTYADALYTRSLGQPTSGAGETEKLKKIVDNSERVLRFTRDLVSYARPAQDLPEELELQAVLDTAVGFCDHVLRKHGVEVVRRYEAVPRVAAVKGNLVQVFVNLVTNACHAMQPGGRVVLATRREEDEVVVGVTDNGTGIDPAHRERIFEPFFTTKPDGKGTGLGLSIVANIVEKHGGRIEVESEVGQGTTFVIRLPVQE